MDNGIFAGLIGGVVGAVLTGIFSFFLLGRSQKFEKRQLNRMRIANAIPLASRLLDEFVNYKPNRLFQAEIGMNLSEQSLIRINSAINLFDESKSVQYLLPQDVRKRWESMLILISEFSNSEQMDATLRNRALCDVQNYIKYVRESLMDLLDEVVLRPDYTRPFLQRDEITNWVEP